MNQIEAQFKLHLARNALMDKMNVPTQRVAEFERAVEVFTRMSFVLAPSADLMAPYLLALAHAQDLTKSG